MICFSMRFRKRCAEFEKLPCVQYIDILRNILYAGVWNKFDKIVNGNEVK